MIDTKTQMATPVVILDRQWNVVASAGCLEALAAMIIDYNDKAGRRRRVSMDAFGDVHSGPVVRWCWETDVDEVVYGPIDYVIRFSGGGIVPADSFKAVCRDLSAKRLAKWRKSRGWRRWDGPEGAPAKGLPVPGTGVRSAYGKCLRSPGTTAEMARTMGDDDLARIVAGEYGVRLRGVRSRRRRLPTRWDDRIRGDLLDRSWKRNRKTRYREKAGREAGLPA